MRETISIDKNYKTGNVEESIKAKPNARTRGKVTVSLFDEKGNKQREIKTENIVYDWVKAYSFKNTYLTNFGLGTMGANNSAAICTGNNTGIVPLSKYLMLFSGDHEDINPKKSLIKDTLVGYAGRYENYSGSDILKGTYNSIESKTSIDEEGNIVFHMVYDFPTHSANGNITGVGLGHTYLRNKELIPYKTDYRNDTSSSVGEGVTKYNIAIATNKDNSLLYGPITSYGSSKKPSLGIIDRSIENTFNPTELPLSKNSSYKPNSFHTSVSCNGYFGLNDETGNVLASYCYNGNISIAKTNGKGNPPLVDGSITIEGKKVDRNLKITTVSPVLNFDFSSLLDLKETVTTTSTNGIASLYASNLLFEDKFVIYIKTEKNSYVCNSTNNSSYIFVFDIDGNYEKYAEITEYTSTSTARIIPYGSDEFLIPLGNGQFIKSDFLLSNIEKVDIESLNINNKDKINLNTIRGLSSDYFAGNYTKKEVFVLDVATSYESNYKLKDDRINLSSYTRLPAPIVKTNIHTMKVQYDLVIEDVSVYDYIEY